MNERDSLNPRSNWRLVKMIRDLDKKAAGMPQTAAHVLLVLALHGDERGECFPSERTIAAETGLSERHVSRTLANLRDRGLIDIKRGRHHEKNRYQLRADTVSSLAAAQYGHRVSPETAREDNGASSDRTSEVSSPARRANQPGPTVLLRSKEDEGRDPDEEVPSALPTSELSEREAFEVADNVAEEHRHPRPQRGSKNVETMKTLIAAALEAAAGKRWTSPRAALRLRLERHHQRPDPFLVDRGYPLSLATQIEQSVPEPPPCPRLPTRPQPPRAPSTDKEIAEMRALLCADPKRAETIERAERAYREHGHADATREYMQALARYEVELPEAQRARAQWRALVERRTGDDDDGIQQEVRR